MAIVEVSGGRITHRYLMNKRKDELASMVMRQLGDLERISKVLTEDHDHSMSLMGGPIPCGCNVCKIARCYK